MCKNLKERTDSTYEITGLEVGLPVEFLNGSRMELIGPGELGLALGLVVGGLLRGGGLGLGLELLLGLTALPCRGFLGLGLALGLLGSRLLGTGLILSVGNHGLGGLGGRSGCDEISGGSLDGKAVVAKAFAE